MRELRRGRTLDVLSMLYKLGIGGIVEDVLSRSGKLGCFEISTNKISSLEKMGMIDPEDRIEITNPEDTADFSWRL